jgi:hypothetical protein
LEERTTLEYITEPEPVSLRAAIADNEIIKENADNQVKAIWNSKSYQDFITALEVANGAIDPFD